MDKKELKFYETPTCEVVEVKVSSMLCASPAPGGSEDIPEDKIDDGFFD